MAFASHTSSELNWVLWYGIRHTFDWVVVLLTAQKDPPYRVFGPMYSPMHITAKFPDGGVWKFVLHSMNSLNFNSIVLRLFIDVVLVVGRLPVIGWFKWASLPLLSLIWFILFVVWSIVDGSEASIHISLSTSFNFHRLLLVITDFDGVLPSDCCIFVRKV